MGNPMKDAALILACAALCGCAGIPGPGPAPACQVGQPMVETTLYLGLLRPGGSVSRYDFARFVEAEVAPRWQEGFTILEGQGVWRSEQRGVTEREPSRVLIRLHDGGAESSAEVEAIRGAYIDAFQQDAVLRTDHHTCASF